MEELGFGLDRQAKHDRPFADSEELLANSGLPHASLVEVGQDHRLADNDPLQAMLKACEKLESER